MDIRISDVYDVGMVRKQLYISEEHERVLKTRAREMGVSEAELVRGLLDRLLLNDDTRGTVPFGRNEIVGEFLKSVDRIADTHSLPEGYRFDREELYEATRGSHRNRRSV